MKRPSSRWRRRAWSVLPVLASLGVVTGMLEASVPNAEAQPRGTDENPVPGLGDLLAPPLAQEPPTSSQEPPSSTQQPPSSTQDPPTSSSGKPTPSLLPPLLGGPSSDKPDPLSPLLPPSSGAPPQLLPSLPAVPPAQPPRLPVGGPADTRPGPGRAWTLTGSTMKLLGSHYHGYSEQQVGGKKVKTLRFTVDRLEITDLVQRADLGNGKVARTASAPGRVSTVSNGPIELYTQELSGTLAVAGLPILPLNLSPDALSLPDLDLSFLQLPDLTFKNVVVHNAELSGGRLTIPGAHISLE